MSSFRDRLYIAGFSKDANRVIREWNLGMEINRTCISDDLGNIERTASDKIITDIAGDIAESGATRLVLHAPFTEIIPAAIDPVMKAAALYRLNQAYSVCERFGVKKMIVHNGWVPFMYFKEWHAKHGAAFWETFMADKPDDFSISLENVLEDEPYMFTELLENVRDPRIGICLDIGHAYCMTSSDYEITDWIKVLSPYLTHLHLHTNDGTHDSHLSFEEGSLNMEEVFDAFESYLGDEVTYTVEAHDAESCLEWMSARRII